MSAYPLVTISLFTFVTLTFGQVSEEEMKSAIRGEGLEALVQKVQKMPAESRQKSAAALSRLIDREFGSTQEYHDGLIYLKAFSRVATDAQLAMCARRYIDKPEDDVRLNVYEALAGGHGPESTSILANRIADLASQLPRPPFRSQGEEGNRRINNQVIAFSYCLRGLLLYNSDEFRKLGRKYVALLRELYANDPNGILFLNELDHEFIKVGIDLGEIVTDSRESKAIGADRGKVSSSSSRQEQNGGVEDALTLRLWPWFLVLLTGALAIGIRRYASSRRK